MIDIILARYQEDINWILPNRNLFDNVYVFNKGSQVPFDDSFKVENLLNLGREAGTYFYFLSNYYDTIEDDKIYIFTNLLILQF